MDAPRQPDGPPVRDGKAYSRIAHLAEDMVRPFVAIGAVLLHLGALPARMPSRLPAKVPTRLSKLRRRRGSAKRRRW